MTVWGHNYMFILEQQFVEMIQRRATGGIKDLLYTLTDYIISTYKWPQHKKYVHASTNRARTQMHP